MHLIAQWRRAVMIIAMPHVRFAPIADKQADVSLSPLCAPCVDGSELARLFFTFAGWSVQPCVRPVCAVHMTAGHNALRGSGPGQKPAFEMCQRASCEQAAQIAIALFANPAELVLAPPGC